MPLNGRALVQLGLQPAVLGGERQLLRGLVQLRSEHARVDRLFDEADRAALHGFHSHRDAAVPADHDHLRVRADRRKSCSRSSPSTSGSIRSIRMMLGLPGGQLFARLLRGGGGVDDVALRFEQQPKKLRAVGMVFHNQDLGSSSTSTRAYHFDAGANAGGAPRGPRPEKVVAADGPERVEHLAAEKQAGMPPAFHRRGSISDRPRRRR